jgi:Flp pilus assembly protein TadD
VHNNLGYAYLLAHREEDARREFATALQRDPQLNKARNNLLRLDQALSASLGKNASAESRP